MKSVTAILFTFALFTGALRAEAVEAKCDRLEHFDISYSAASVEADLVTGTWDVRVAHAFGTMYFYEDGTADHVNTYYDGREIETFNWYVRIVEEFAVLTIEYPDGKNEEFTLIPTCDGYAVINCNGKNGTAHKVTNSSMSMLNQARRQITGSWVSVAQRKRDEGREMSWVFRENGRFGFAISPDYHHMVLEGVWDLTPDGEHVMLFFTTLDSPEAVYAREILTIRILDFEDMVLMGDTFRKYLDNRQKDGAVSFVKSDTQVLVN